MLARVKDRSRGRARGPGRLRPPGSTRVAQAPLGALIADCSAGSWTEEDDRIASPRQLLTSRAARWATVQVGRIARSVNEVAQELGCDWHTVNDTVVAYGEALLDADEERIGEVSALGLDEVLMVRIGPSHRQHFSTQIVDVRAGQLLDVVPGRGSAEPMGWLAEQRRGSVSASSSAPSTSRAPIDMCSRSWCPTPPWSPIPSTSPSWPTPSSTSADAGSRTRPSVIGDARPIRSIGAGVC